MSFGHPLLLLSLLVVPFAIGLYMLAERRRMRYAVVFTNLDVLASVVGGRPVRRYVPPALFFVALAALCIALARPQRHALVPSDRATVILVVDVSRSMEATDVKPTRLGAAQAALRTFLDHVPKRVHVGLIAFAGEAQVASPPTTDHSAVRTSLDDLSFFNGFGGTAIGDALAAAVQLGKTALPGGKPQQTIAFTLRKPGSSLVSILFLSDGHQTRGDLQPLEGAQLAKDAGIPVYTIALGTPNGRLTRDAGPFFGGPQSIPVVPDPATLSAIARLTGGKFFEARTAQAVSSAYAHLASLVAGVPGRSEVTYIFLALAAAFVLAALTLSLLWSPRLP